MHNLDEQIEYMKKVAKSLVAYTAPYATNEDEQKILILKQRTIVVDGYDVVVCLSVADYEKYMLWSLQIQSVYFPFMPFNVICKLGKKFLGDQHLGFFELMKDGKKVYCWTLKEHFGEIISPGKKAKFGSYEGFEYEILNKDVIGMF